MSRQPPPEVVAAARASAKRWSIPASVTLAQWALESGWGQHLSAPHNPFGMKALAGQASQTVLTREVYKGQSVTVKQAFRAFASDADAFDAHAKLLATAGVYAIARAALPDPYTFADRLGGGTPAHPNYSTDPHYGSALAAIMHGSDLTRHDA